ncbi:hypothetical protein [Gordonia sihwensis]|uniref:hypothetical protein n=1 Tax=Gordonia sihwensis TaxID=173559 RepID=UPI003D98BDB3
MPRYLTDTEQADFTELFTTSAPQEHIAAAATTIMMRIMETHAWAKFWADPSRSLIGAVETTDGRRAPLDDYAVIDELHNVVGNLPHGAFTYIPGQPAGQENLVTTTSLLHTRS